MAYIRYDKPCRSEFRNNVSAKERVQDKNLYRLKLKVNDTYKKDEKITTSVEASNPEDVVNKSFIDTKLAEGRSKWS